MRRTSSPVLTRRGSISSLFETVTLFLGLVVPLTLSPGPVNIVLAGLGSRIGVRRAIPFLLGLSLSAAAITGLGGYGLILVFQTNALVYASVKYAGVAYIAYLGVKLIRAPAVRNEGGGGAIDDETPEMGFVQGMILTVLNPKFYIMVIIIFAQFATPEGGTALVAGAVILVLFVSQTFWLAAGGAVRHLIRNDRARRLQNVVFGTVLLAVAAFIALPL